MLASLLGSESRKQMGRDCKPLLTIQQTADQHQAHLLVSFRFPVSRYLDEQTAEHAMDKGLG